MSSIEKRIIAFVQRHILLLAVVFSTIVTMYVRYSYRGFISRDMEIFLLKWFDTIKNGGRLQALSAPVGNYNIPYQTIIALFTYLPFRPEYMYKGLSIIFDYLMAWVMAQVTYDLTQKRSLQTIVYIVVSGLPVVVLNSAAWGQCDSIYTFFCILSIWLFMREKYLLCFITFSVAFAFKLQAVFLLPFYLFVWLYRERFSILNFFLIPLVDAIMCLPGIIAGQGVEGIISPYVGQVDQSIRISMRYPSFWFFLLESKRNDDNNIIAQKLAIVSVILILACIFIVLLQKRPDLSPVNAFKLAFLTIYTCVLFLPSMHERYSYMYVILGVVIAVLDIRTLPAYAVLLLIDLQTYGNYLFKLKANLMPWVLLAVLNLGVYLLYFFYLLVPMVRTPATASNMPIESDLER